MMQNLKFAKKLCALAFVLSCILLTAAFYFQPKISDDFQYMWMADDAGGMINYWSSEYKTWTGRVPLIILPSVILVDPMIEKFYRLLIIGELIALVLLAWYCARGKFGWSDPARITQLMIFGNLLWLALPSRAETVVWLSGNFVYLVPSILGLAYIAWNSYTASNPVEARSTGYKTHVKLIAGFLIGFFAGSSQEQIVAACSMFLAFQLYRLFADKKLSLLHGSYWSGLAGFLSGIIFLVSAPGNLARINALDAPSLFQIIGRMGLFIPGAFFELGVNGTGKSIWTGILLLVILYVGKSGKGPGARFKQFSVWLLISFASLFAMLPATNFITIRVTFFAVLFLYIGVASMFDDTADEPLRLKSVLVLLVVSALVIAEAVSGLIANISISREMQMRNQIIQSSQGTAVSVPFISTQPSTLSYIDTPEHDREFLVLLSKHLGKTIMLDNGVHSPLPGSLNPMKSIKNSIGR